MAGPDPSGLLEGMLIGARDGGQARHIDLKSFVQDLVTACGGIVEAPEDDVLHVALPGETATKLSLREFAVLAFDYDAARETPQAEFVTFGSPVLDRLVLLGIQLGRVTRQCAVVPSVRVPPNLMKRIESRIGFNRSRRPVLRTAAIELYERAVLRFVVSYVSDERFVEALVIGVDTTTLADDTDLLDEARTVYYSSEPRPTTVRGAPYGEVVRKAVSYLQARARSRLAAHQAEVRGHCEKELTTVLGFYEKTMADLVARRDAAADDPEKKARLEAKIEACRLDRERRISDVVGKYRMTAQARLDSVTLQVMPRVRALLEVEHRDSIYEQAVFYNLATNAVEPLTCPRCGRRFFSAYPARDGVFVCRPEEAE